MKERLCLILVLNNEKKNILSDVKSLVSQNSYKVRYYKSGNQQYEPGIQENPGSSLSEFKGYSSVVQEVDEFTKKRYDYGDTIEGDLILLLPYDTELPTDASKYEFKYNEIVFTTSSIQREQLLDGTVTHYYLVGKR